MDKYGEDFMNLILGGLDNAKAEAAGAVCRALATPEGEEFMKQLSAAFSTCMEEALKEDDK